MISFLVSLLVGGAAMLAMNIVSAGEAFAATPPPGCVSAYQGLPGEDPTVVRCDQPAAMCSSDANCASLGYQDAYGVTPDKVREYSDSYRLQDDETPDAVADCLLQRGYRGIPGDGQARIYAPAQQIEWCSTHTA